MNRDRTRYLIAFLGLLVILLLYFHPAVFGGKIQGQFDHLFRFHPWKTMVGEEFKDQNPLLADQALTLIPFFKRVGSSLAEGTVPLWNPNSLGGTPLLGNYSSSMFCPFYWIYFLFEADELLIWCGISMLLFSGFFAFLYLRTIGCSNLAGFLGGTVFMLSGFNILWLFHQQMKAAVFLPCIFYLIERALRSKKAYPYLFFGLVTGVQLYAGHLETSFHIQVGASLYFLVRLFQIKELRDRRFSHFIKFSLVTLLGGLLSCCQVLPFLEYMIHSSIYYQRSMEAQAALDIFSFGDFSWHNFKILALLFHPDLWGSPLDYDFTGPLNYNEINGAYIGIVPMAMALCSLFMKNKTAIHKLVICFALFTAAVIIRVPIIYPLVKSLPVFSISSTHRILLLLGFFNTIMAAFFVHRLFLILKTQGLRSVIFTLFLAVLCGDLYLFGGKYNPAVEKEMVYPRTETIDFLLNDPGLFRISTPTPVFPHETHLPYGISSVRGYDALELRTYTEFMSLLSDHEHAEHFVFATTYYNRKSSRLFDLLNTKYFLSPPDRLLGDGGLSLVHSGETNIYLNESFYERAFLVPDFVVEEDKEKRLALLSAPEFDPLEKVVLEEELTFEPSDIAGSEVKIMEHQTNLYTIRVNSPGKAFLVLSDNFFPGWEATINGEPAEILRAYHTFKTVIVPPGESEVVFRYDPMSYILGCILSVIALKLLILGGVYIKLTSR